MHQVACGMLLLALVPCEAADIFVPADSTLLAALQSAPEGVSADDHVIWLAPGQYTSDNMYIANGQTFTIRALDPHTTHIEHTANNTMFDLREDARVALVGLHLDCGPHGCARTNADTDLTLDQVVIASHDANTLHPQIRHQADGVLDIRRSTFHPNRVTNKITPVRPGIVVCRLHCFPSSELI